jgi:cytosine/adenosine deaminase-related metal-dependent hydrolase
VTDPAAQLLYAADRENVSHVWVAGDLVAFRPQQNDYLNKKASFEMKTLAKKWQNMP